MKGCSAVYQLKTTLQGTRPPIWRRMQVPATLRLCCLHDVLQEVMGWTDSHLHRFEKDGKCWGVPEDLEGDDGIEITDERGTNVGAVLKTEGDSLLYIYDFGDNWRHDVKLEMILPVLAAVARPVCVAGERHCPPEDVGGPSGYDEFLEVIFEPRHEDFEHCITWAGGPSAVNRSVGRFQPEEFDLKAVNDLLSRTRGHHLHMDAATAR